MNHRTIDQRQAIVIELGMIALALKCLMGKRKGYSGATDPYRNFRTAKVLTGTEPWAGAIDREGDKIARMRSMGERLDEGGKGSDSVEGFADPFFDSINYLGGILPGLQMELMDTEEFSQTMDKLEEEAEDLFGVVVNFIDEWDIPRPQASTPVNIVKGVKDGSN